MIQEIIERAHQYYVGFTHLPIEGQVIVGAGMLVLLAALRNLWRMLYPVRWTAASLLRIAAFLMSPRGRKSKKADSVELAVDVIPFDLSNKKKATKTYDYYGGTGAVENLHNDQIELLSAAVVKFGLSGHGGLTQERRRRSDNLVPSAPPVDTSALEARITELEAIPNAPPAPPPPPPPFRASVEDVT